MSTAKVKAVAAKAAPAAAAKAVPAAAAKAVPAGPQVASDAVQPVERAVAVGEEAVATVAAASKDAVESVSTQVDSAVTAPAAAFQAYEDAVSSARDAVDAVAQAGTIFSRGLQDIGHLVLGLARAGVEEGVAASQQLLAAKTLRELVEVQSAVAKQQFDRLLGESARLSDLSVKLVEESLAPLTERVTATVEMLVKRAA